MTESHPDDQSLPFPGSVSKLAPASCRSACPGTVTTVKRVPSPSSGLHLCTGESGLPSSAQNVIHALDAMSRRIDDLARELHCLGYFDDESDGPRAA